jgi:hypothetical protein
MTTPARFDSVPAGKRAAEPMWFILRWQWIATVNRVRIFATNNPRDCVILSLGVCVLIGYWLNILHSLCNLWLRNAHGTAPTSWNGPTVAVACIGGTAGFVAAGFALRLGNRAWVASLPLSATDRARAAGVFAIAVGGATAVLAAILGLLISDWLRRGLPLLDAAVAAAAYFAGFSALTILRLLLARINHIGRLPSAPTMQDIGVAPVSLLAGFDQSRPRWLGHWVLGGAAALRLSPFLCCVVLVNAIGVTASFVQAQALPALALAVLTSHLIYLRRLDMSPLASPVLRSTPLGFHAALFGIVRLPLLLSLAATAPMMITALAIEPAHAESTLAFLFLLLPLALQFSVLAAGMPTSKRMATMLHLTIVVMAVKEGVDYQYWVAAGVIIIACLIWWRAKRSYQAHA